MYYFLTDNQGYVCSAVFASIEDAFDYARPLFERDSFSDTSVFRVHRFSLDSAGGVIFEPCVANLFRDGHQIYSELGGVLSVRTVVE